jgi:hypothetical protein
MGSPDDWPSSTPSWPARSLHLLTSQYVVSTESSTQLTDKDIGGGSEEEEEEASAKPKPVKTRASNKKAVKAENRRGLSPEKEGQDDRRDFDRPLR